MVEQNAHRHLCGLRHVGEPARYGLFEIDLALLDQQMKAGCHKGLGAAGNAKGVIGSHRDLLELVGKPAGEQRHLLARHADGERCADHASLDMLVQNGLDTALWYAHDHLPC